MHRDAAPDPDPEGADFFGAGAIPNPDSNGRFITVAFDSKFPQCGNDDLLEHSNISSDGQMVIVQPNNRINDKLARPMKGNVAATIGLNDFDAKLIKKRFS